jgi:hypothetical protein
MRLRIAGIRPTPEAYPLSGMFWEVAFSVACKLYLKPNMIRMTRFLKSMGLLTAQMVIGWAANAAVQPGDDLQAVLNRGEDLALQPGAVYPISQTLKYTKPGQKIYTADAINLANYATLLLVNPDQLEIIDAHGMAGAVLEHVIVDGNRYELSAPRKLPRVGQAPLNFFGGKGAEGQIIRNNLFRSTRSWSKSVNSVM